jgi:hypothetical protein
MNNTAGVDDLHGIGQLWQTASEGENPCYHLLAKRAGVAKASYDNAGPHLVEDRLLLIMSKLCR